MTQPDSEKGISDFETFRKGERKMKLSYFGYDWHAVFGVSGDFQPTPYSWICESIFDDRNTIYISFTLPKNGPPIVRPEQVNNVKIQIRGCQRFPVLFYDAELRSDEGAVDCVRGAIADDGRAGEQLIVDLLHYAWRFDAPF